MQEVKHHPASVDLELIKRLAATTKCKSLQQFLYKEFSCISKDFAGANPALDLSLFTALGDQPVEEPDFNVYQMKVLR